LAEGGVSHRHFRCGRPSGRNKDAFGRDDSIPIIASNIDLSCIGLAFAFFNTTEESSKLRQRWGAEVTDLVGKGFRRDVLLGVDHCGEVIELTTKSYKQYRQGARFSSAKYSRNAEV